MDYTPSPNLNIQKDVSWKTGHERLLVYFLNLCICYVHSDEQTQLEDWTKRTMEGLSSGLAFSMGAGWWNETKSMVSALMGQWGPGHLE